MAKYLEIKNLWRRFKTPAKIFYALKDVSFSLEKNEFIGLVGPSGSGKSTLAKILVGLIPPSSGEIIFKQKKLSFPFPKEFRPYFQMVFQEPLSSFNPRFCALEIVSEPLIINHLSPDIALEKAYQMILNVGLKKEHLYKKPFELSGGEAQRLALARAMVLQPEILILDEVTSGLDPITSREILMLIQQTAKQNNSTVIFITHNLAFALKFCRRILFLIEGKIAGEISPEKEILSEPAKEMLKLTKDELNFLESKAQNF